MINDIAQFVIDQGFTEQITLWGANDIEMNYSKPQPAIDWTDGYYEQTDIPFVNYGDAGGCPQSGSASGVNGNCNNDWKQSNVWYVSWGNPLAYPLPEIYTTNSSQAKQWQQISLYGYLNQDGAKLHFKGTMTQYGACQQAGGCTGTNNTASAGWQQLQDKVNADSRTAVSIPYSTDIKYSKYPY